HEGNVKKKPGPSSSQQNLSVLPESKETAEITKTWLRRSLKAPLQVKLFINVLFRFFDVQTVHKSNDIAHSIRLVARNVQSVADCFWNREPKIQRDHCGKNPHSVNNSP